MAVQLNQTNALPYSYLGILFADMGNYEESIKNLARTIELEPSFALHYFRRAYYYDLMGKK